MSLGHLGRKAASAVGAGNVVWIFNGGQRRQVGHLPALGEHLLHLPGLAQGLDEDLVLLPPVVPPGGLVLQKGNAVRAAGAVSLCSQPPSQGPARAPLPERSLLVKSLPHKLIPQRGSQGPALRFEGLPAGDGSTWKEKNQRTQPKECREMPQLLCRNRAVRFHCPHFISPFYCPFFQSAPCSPPSVTDPLCPDTSILTTARNESSGAHPRRITETSQLGLIPPENISLILNRSTYPAGKCLSGAIAALCPPALCTHEDAPVPVRTRAQGRRNVSRTCGLREAKGPHVT